MKEYIDVLYEKNDIADSKLLKILLNNDKILTKYLFKRARETITVLDQFSIEDERSPLEVVKSLVRDGFIPSYCTACYRSGRTGDIMMELAKEGKISKSCTPNALMTLMEYVLDYGDDELYQLCENLINSEIDNIETGNKREYVKKKIEELKDNKRDFFI